MKFAQPAWLVLLALLPLLGAGALVVARLRGRQWAAFVAPRLRGVLLKHGSGLPRWLALMFLLAACAAIVGALARPQSDAGIRTEKSLGRNLLIALDLSRSMRVKDVKPDRLARAKMVIYELLDAMPNERIGLIGFAGAAYVYAPLTVDHAAVRATVEPIDETWVPVGGSNLAAAIHLATATLKKTGQKNNALVILSDGEKHEGDLDTMVREAAQSGVYILAVGVGTEDGDYVPNPEFPGNRMVDRAGNPVISRLQPEVLRRLALQTKGRYAAAGTGADIPAMVKSAVKDLDAFEMEGRERSVFIEFYQWLVLPAIVFLTLSILAATRWRAVHAAAAVAAVVFLTPSGARADAVADARNALEQKRYPQAREAYHQLAERATLADRRARFHLGEATAAYLGGDFPQARAAYSRALLGSDPAVRAHAAVGMGNTMFQLGWQALSAEAYPADARQAPSLATFDSWVDARLAAAREADDSAHGPAVMAGLITNWADAVRHFDSALAADPSNKEALVNRRTVMIYLKRLEERLAEDQRQAEQSLPQPPAGEGAPPPPGPDAPKEPPAGQQGGEPGPKPPPGTQGPGDDTPKDGEEQAPAGDKSGDKPDGKEAGNDPGEPGETPEQRARRILSENADLEKGPLSPGRIEFKSPKQDW